MTAPGPDALEGRLPPVVVVRMVVAYDDAHDPTDAGVRRAVQAAWDASPGPKLVSFLTYALEASWAGNGMDGGDIQDTAERLGLIAAVPYDPAVHGDSTEAVAGDPWYVMTLAPPPETQP